MNQDRIIKVVDENGKEVEMFVLFVTRLDEFNKDYIFYTDPKDEEGQVFVSSFDEQQRLQPIEANEEWEALDEVFNQFIEEQQEVIDKCSNCSSDCSSCSEECNCDK